MKETDLNKIIPAVIFTLLFVSASGFAQHSHENPARHLKDSTLKMTELNKYSVEMAIDKNRLLVGTNAVGIMIYDTHGKKVTGADITFTPWMPEMGHGVFTDPVVTEKENGLYRIDNIILVMGGHWELRFNINKDGSEDSIVFDFPVVRTSLEYNYIREDTPAGYNAVLGMKNPLEELDYKTVKEDSETIKVFEMTVRDVGFEIYPEKPMMGWGFNGQIPGPTIRVTQGDKIRIILKNDSTGEHTLHVHGQRKPVIMDGVPFLGQKPIKRGESYTYEFTVSNLGTSWYHCHVDSAHHVDMGMYGAFIVEPKNEKLQYDREYVMVIDEWPTAHVHVHEGDNDEMENHDAHGEMTMHEGSPPEHMHAEDKKKKRDWYPKTYAPRNEIYDGFTINGKSFPMTEPIRVKEGERVRMRFINAGYQQHFMHTHSHKFTVVARDGAYVDEPEKVDTVGVGPGNRVDVIMVADNPGIWPFHCHRLNHVTNEHTYPGGMLTFIQYID